MARTKLTPKLLLLTDPGTDKPARVRSLFGALELQLVIVTDPQNAYLRWAEEMPDLVLFDLDLPGSGLMELVNRIRCETTIPLLVLTATLSEYFLVDLYRAGADECIHKPVGAALLQAILKVWLKRSGSAAAELLAPLCAGGVQLIPTEQVVHLANGQTVQLTNLELRLLFSLMSQPGHCLPTEGLIQRVWGDRGEGDSTTLKNIVYRLRRKIESDPAEPRLVQIVAGLGYRFGGQG